MVNQVLVDKYEKQKASKVDVVNKSNNVNKTNNVVNKSSVNNQNNQSDKIAYNIVENVYKSKALLSVCGNKKNFDEFVACVSCQVKKSPDLQKCSIISILDCCIQSAQLGLKIDANNYAYLLPMKNSKTGQFICTLIIGYKGYVDIIRRDKNVASVSCFTVSIKDVKEGRFFINEGENRGFVYRRDPLQSEASLMEEDIAGFCSVVYYKDSNKYDYSYLTKEDVNKIRNNTKSYKYQQDKTNTVWFNHYVAMGKKTAFRQLVKWCNFSGTDKLNEIDNQDYDDIKEKKEPTINKTMEELASEAVETDGNTNAENQDTDDKVEVESVK